MDEYSSFISECCVGLETAYGLRGNNKELLSTDSQELFDILERRSRALEPSARSALFRSHYEATSNLSYINERLEYYSYVRVDFTGYPQIERLREALWVFNRRANIKDDFFQYAKFIISLLGIVESKYPELKEGLTYRLLRILVAMLIYQNFTEASVVSNLLTNQLRRSA